LHGGGKWDGGHVSDPRLPDRLIADPRLSEPLGKAQKAALGAKGLSGMNTESFDPASTLVRPQMRIQVGPKAERYDRPVKHDDVIIVPEFFCKEDDFKLYYELIEEMRDAQAGMGSQARGAEWIPWHEGAHLISKNPTGSKAFKKIQDRMGDYFGMTQASRGTRFNWYRGTSDWKVGPYK